MDERARLPMNPKEVRERLLERHDALRTVLREVERIAGAPRLDGRRLAERVAALAQGHREYRALEAEVLEPALAACDPWGCERLARIGVDHARSEVEVSELLAAAGEAHPEVKRIALLVTRAASGLRGVLDREVRTLLLPEVLRDHVVRTDQSDG